MKTINNIWLIDDDLLFRICTEVLVKDNDLAKNIELIDGATSAIDELKNITAKGGQMPDAIFVDLNMPEMNGWEFIESVIELDLIDYSKTVIYILSSSLDPRDFARAETYEQLSGFVQKPITPDSLKNILDEAVLKLESISN